LIIATSFPLITKTHEHKKMPKSSQHGSRRLAVQLPPPGHS